MVARFSPMDPHPMIAARRYWFGKNAFYHLDSEHLCKIRLILGLSRTII